MKKSIWLLAFGFWLFAAGCSSDQPQECYISKNTVELAGNGFSSFSLGGDVKLFTVEDPENKGQWTIQAVVPVRKEVGSVLKELSMSLNMLDERKLHVRDGLVLRGEDMSNLLPVYNAGEDVERSIVFSVKDEKKKYMSYQEVAHLLEKTKNIRMNFNIATEEETVAETPAATTKTDTKATTKSTTKTTEATKSSTVTEYPMTLDGLCRKHGIYGRLAQYESALRRGDRKGAKQIEDNMWAIEKRVKADASIPERLRDSFVRYIEDKEDEIEDRY